MAPGPLQRIGSVASKELLHIVRDPMTLFFAVFIPVLLMGGIVGRVFREFAVTIAQGRYHLWCVTRLTAADYVHVDPDTGVGVQQLLDFERAAPAPFRPHCLLSDRCAYAIQWQCASGLCNPYSAVTRPFLMAYKTACERSNTPSLW